MWVRSLIDANHNNDPVRSSFSCHCPLAALGGGGSGDAAYHATKNPGVYGSCAITVEHPPKPTGSNTAVWRITEPVPSS